MKENININNESISYYEQESALALKFINFLKQKNKPPHFLRSLFDDDFLILHRRNLYTRFEREFFMERLWIPGRARLLVNTNGDFHFCTNLSSNMSIGNIFSGFDFDKINRLIENYIKVNQDCLCCWAIRVCPACYFYAAKGEDFDIDQKRQVCKVIRKRFEKIIIYYNEVLEENPNAFDYLIEVAEKVDRKEDLY